MSPYTRTFSDAIWQQVNVANKALLNDYLLELKQQKKSSGTIYQYNADLRAFLCYVYEHNDNKSLLVMSKKDFRDYSIHLIYNNKVSNARHNRVISIIRQIMDYAESDDDLDYDNNLARRVKGLCHEPVRDITFLTDDNILRLCDTLVSHEQYQQATMLMLAYDSAGRKAELAQVTKYSFFKDNRHNTNVVTGKGNKLFSLLYFDHTRDLALKYLEHCDTCFDLLWSTNDISEAKCKIYTWCTEFKKILTDTGISANSFSPHSLRHSSLTNYENDTHYMCKLLGNNGFPLDKLRLIAHHNSVDTTMGYLPDTSTNELEEMFGIKMH